MVMFNPTSQTLLAQHDGFNLANDKIIIRLFLEMGPVMSNVMDLYFPSVEIKWNDTSSAGGVFLGATSECHVRKSHISMSQESSKCFVYVGKSHSSILHHFG